MQLPTLMLDRRDVSFRRFASGLMPDYSFPSGCLLGFTEFLCIDV